MSIPVQCPSCGFTFRVEARFAGRRGRCPQPECGSEYEVPARRNRPAGTKTTSAASALPVAESGLPKQVYLAASGLAACLLLLIGTAVYVPARMKAASAAQEPRAEAAAAGQAADDKPADDKRPNDEQLYQTSVRPFLKTYCYDCHGPDALTEGISFHQYENLKSVLAARKTWEKTLKQLEAGAMPPADHEPQPTAEERKQVVAWLDRALYDVDCELIDDPGRVTIRRLNGAEYNNTIRDLVGVDFEPAKDFPSDDVGYGFDNIGDVLSLPTLLMEKYLNAAGQIARKAVVGDIGAMNAQRFAADKLNRGPWSITGDGFVGINSNGEVSAMAEFPLGGEYLLRVEAKARQAGDEPARMRLLLDGQPLKVFEIKGEGEAAIYEFPLEVEKGKHKIAAAFINDYYNPKAKKRGERDRNLHVRFLEVRGPLNVAPENLPATHRRIVISRPGEGKSVRESAMEIFLKFATRAYRRPVTAEELAQLADLVELAVERGDTFEQGVQIGMQAVLVSPHFLFRIENDKRPHDPSVRHDIDHYELATRLSYFLWSSMPDEELFDLAGQGKLDDSEVLERQVRRMLADPRSQALVENFAHQWLNLRNLAGIQPDPQQFPNFSEELRADMLRETSLFFADIIRQDRSLLDLIDGKYTYVNERLAKHYGLEGVSGDEFRRVPLKGTPRSGVLTQASVLMVTSDPTKTKPVLRGKWILQNILGSAPPPPPANVPALEETAEANPDAPLREQLALHLSNPTCASCHETMDPIGFGFENFDAVGRWRDKDGQHDIDPSGKLPSGETFDSPAELIEILSRRDEQFARTAAKKMLTYAIGRGLEYYDRCAINRIVSAAGRKDYRFSAFVLEVVNSRPFQMRRGEKPPK